MIKNLVLIIIIFPFLALLCNAKQCQNDYLITSSCIGKVCIGDTLPQIQSKYPNFKIKPNDQNTSYDIFDPNGEFILEFSNKKSNKKPNLPTRYIMTSNVKFKYENSSIQIGSSIWDLERNYGKPIYESGPDGYVVYLEKWPVKSNLVKGKYTINTVVNVYNSRLADLVEEDNSIDENKEINLLKSDPKNTYISTFELYSDSDHTGTSLK